jgi:hypothetical protein
MRVSKRYSTLILPLVTLLLSEWGCAHMPTPPPEEMKAQFGRIGIVSARSNPKIQFHPGFAKGRLSGAAIGFSVGLGSGILYGGLVGAAASAPSGGLVAPYAAAGVAAIGGVIGGVYGGIKGAADAVPREESKRIEATAKNAFDGLDIQKTVAASVLKYSLELPDYTFVLLEQDGSIISTPYNFNLLRERGIGTLLELNVKSGGFKEGKSKNPLMALFMEVHIRLIRTMDGKEIYSKELEYKSQKHNSADWLDTDGRLLREEIGNCFKELPSQIVEELFRKQSL